MRAATTSARPSHGWHTAGTTSARNGPLAADRTLRARNAAPDDVVARLGPLDPATLSGAQLDELADACFWLDRPDESTVRRAQAHRAHAAAGDAERAALSAWRAFYDHYLVGELVVAAGWLERARSCAGRATDARAAGWVAIADADLALAHGTPDVACRLACDARAVAEAVGDADLAAMAGQAEGRSLVALGRTDAGLARLDAAMVAVVAGELDPTFTGWVFCNVLGTCHDLADLRRASEWTDAALRWCGEQAGGLLYRGLCRLHAVELQCLRGEWAVAARDAQRACDELTAHDPRYAGEAHYLVGEVRRLLGDLEGAVAAFDRAHELGRPPLPGLALVQVARGRAPEALRALQEALDEPAPLAQRAELLAATVLAARAAVDGSSAAAAAEQLRALALASGSELVAAAALAAEGAVLLAADDAAAAARLRAAWEACTRLGLVGRAAHVQVDLAAAVRRTGDDDAADRALRSALATFERLGATREVDLVAALLGRPPASPLTARQVDVLRLVARGATNREIGAALFVSEHTVARHLANVFARTGTSSRAAATAWAYDHGLVGGSPGAS
jgi:DNA-binding NarL/FixJ family response regulator